MTTCKRCKITHWRSGECHALPQAVICDPPEPTVIDESDLAPGMAGARCIFGGRAGGCGAGTMTPRDELKAGLWVWRGDWVIGREPPRTDRLVAIHKSGDAVAQVKIIDDNLDAAIDQMLERFT